MSKVLTRKELLEMDIDEYNAAMELQWGRDKVTKKLTGNLQICKHCGRKYVICCICDAAEKRWKEMMGGICHVPPECIFGRDYQQELLPDLSPYYRYAVIWEELNLSPSLISREYNISLRSMVIGGICDETPNEYDSETFAGVCREIMRDTKLYQHFKSEVADRLKKIKSRLNAMMTSDPIFDEASTFPPGKEEK